MITTTQKIYYNYLRPSLQHINNSKWEYWDLTKEYTQEFWTVTKEAFIFAFRHPEVMRRL